ncbi:MAG: hypothetical protein ACXVDV_19660, partial [Bacteroidia bacterium]
MNTFERVTKKIFQNFGILIRKYTPATSEELRRIKLLEYYNVDLVFDIGANKGITVGDTGKVYYTVRIEGKDRPIYIASFEVTH